MGTYAVTSTIIFFSGVTQSLSGFGAMMLSLQLLAIFVNVKIAIPLMGIFGLVIPLLPFIQLRKHLNWRKIHPLFLGAFLGVPTGVFLLKKFDEDAIQRILGGILISDALFSLFWKSSNKGLRETWAMGAYEKSIIRR